MKVHYIPADIIFDKLRRDYGFQEQQKNENDILEWITECLREININKIYYTKITDCSGDGDCPIEIKGYRGKLPCDFVEYISARKSGETLPLHYGTDDFFTAKEPLKNRDWNMVCYDDITIQSGTIFTDFEEGYLELLYKAMPVDDEGFPLIPDTQIIINAVTTRVAYRLAYKLMFHSDKYVRIKDELKDIQSSNLMKARAYCNTPSFREALQTATMMRAIPIRTYMGDFNMKDLGAASR